MTLLKSILFFCFLSDTLKRAEEIAKVVSVQYGEPTGPPILTTKDAVEKEAFFEEPQYSMPLEDIESNHFISLSIFMLPLF